MVVMIRWTNRNGQVVTVIMTIVCIVFFFLNEVDVDYLGTLKNDNVDIGVRFGVSVSVSVSLSVSIDCFD